MHRGAGSCVLLMLFPTMTAVPPPLPPTDATPKPSRRTLWIVLGCSAAVFVFSLPILLAILIPTVGKVRETAQRTVAASNLRQIAQASLLVAVTNDEKLPSSGSIQDVAVALAKDGGLNEAAMWFTATDQGRRGPAPYPDGAGVILGSDHATIDPVFAAQQVFAWDYATGLTIGLPANTPLAWTRGLRADGTWDPNAGVYGGAGGIIAFLGGNVGFFPDLKATPLARSDGSPTSNILETLPPTARVVGSGPGTLHGATGRGHGGH